MNNDQGRELAWDDSIEKESEFILLPEGDYDFTVTAFERGRHPGSAKLPACNKAIITLEVMDDEGGRVTLQHNLFLHTTTEGILSSFFLAIGQKKKGEKLTMNWNSVVGSTGRCRIYVDTWTGKDSEEKHKYKPWRRSPKRPH